MEPQVDGRNADVMDFDVDLDQLDFNTLFVGNVDDAYLDDTLPLPHGASSVTDDYNAAAGGLARQDRMLNWICSTTNPIAIERPSLSVSQHFRPGLFDVPERHNRPGARDCGVLDMLPGSKGSGSQRMPQSQEQSSDSQSSAKSSINPSGNKVPESTQISSEKTKQRKPQPRIPKTAKRILEKHFAIDPYPTKKEIDTLALLTNQDPNRIRNWFGNARSRKKIPDRPRDDSTHPDNVTKLSPESLGRLAKEPHSNQKPPINAYLATSIEDEPASLSAIQAALTNFDRSSSGSNIARTGSGTSLWASSGDSISSHGSNLSSTGRSRRKGRRRFSACFSPYPDANSRTTIVKFKFYCTFCWKGFKNKYEWSRHEASVHVIQKSWVCCPPQGDLASCPFCGVDQPSKLHLDRHGYYVCQNKPEELRTFYRKDQFIQHVKNVHIRPRDIARAEQKGSDIMPLAGQLAITWFRDAPSLPPDDPALKCGFCGKQFDTWTDRSDHVHDHFAEDELDRHTWWAERLAAPLPYIQVNFGYSDRYRCLNCQGVYPKPSHHRTCRIWSCRFLKDYRSLTTVSDGTSTCNLCPDLRLISNNEPPHFEQSHRYRICDQSIFSHEHNFHLHLHEAHGVHPTALKSKFLKAFCREIPATLEPVMVEFLPWERPSIRVDDLR